MLFDLGEATLRPQGARVLDAIAPVLKNLPNEMVVEGHTDNLPISDARFASNWELSTQRATTVLRHLLDRAASPRARSPPPATPTSARSTPDATAAGRARNRRVAIVILTPGPPRRAAGRRPGRRPGRARPSPAVPANPAVPGA